MNEFQLQQLVDRATRNAQRCIEQESDGASQREARLWTQLADVADALSAMKARRSSYSGGAPPKQA